MEVLLMFETRLHVRADSQQYGRASQRMHELAGTIPALVSINGYQSNDGEEIDIVHFRDETALEAWRTHPEQLATQERGRKEFYDRFSVQACRVFREYEFTLD